MAALIKAGEMAESLQLLIKTTIHDVGSEGTETKIYWGCYIEDCINRDLLQAVEGSETTSWQEYKAGVHYNKLLMS